MLEEDAFVPAVELEHAGKWPREHWRPVFQGQTRTISEGDMDAIDTAPALRESVTR